MCRYFETLGEMRELISNLSSEQTHKEVQVRVEPIIHAQDDAVRIVRSRTIFLKSQLTLTRIRIKHTGTILA